MALVRLDSLGPGVLQDTDGNAIPTRQVNIFNRDGSTPVQVYQDEAGTIPVSQPLTTDSAGQIPGFVLPGQNVDFYDVPTGGRKQVTVPVDPVAAVTDSSADSTSPVVAPSSPRNRALRDWTSVKDFGGSLSTAVANANGKIVFVPPGTYSTAPVITAVPLYGDDPETTRIVRSDTAGGDFIRCTASHVSIRGLTIDGQRANQPQGTAGGSLAILKPNGTCPSGAFAGGMTLASDAAANATSITVNTATFGTVTVQPGDMLSLVDGAKYEYAQVADSYTAGATTIPLYDPLSQSYSHTTCNVVCCPTGVNVSDCVIWGGQRDGAYIWNGADCKMVKNRVYDCADTGLDLPAGGFRNIIAGNTVRLNGRYGIGNDTTGSTAFIPLASENIITQNRIAITSGGSDPNGAMLYGIIVLLAQHIDISENAIDISKAGVDAIRLQGQLYANVLGNRIVGARNSGSGASATNTRGIHEFNSSGADSRSRFAGNVIRGTDRGIMLEKTRHALVTDNEVYDVLNFGIDFEVDTSNQQTFIVTGNQIDGCVAGIRGGGTGGTSIIKTGLNSIFNASFATITSDAGWTVSSITGFP